MHCKDKMPKIWNKYSQKRNIGVSVPISAFICLWANNIFPRWVCIYCWRKYVDWSREYIRVNRSQTHECGNWGLDHAIPRKGIYKRNCRCSVRRLAIAYRTYSQDSISSFDTLKKSDLFLYFSSCPLGAWKFPEENADKVILHAYVNLNALCNTLPSFILDVQ